MAPGCSKQRCSCFGSSFKTKAIEFAQKMNVENFKASDGWLDRWKERFNVSFKTVSGESNVCTDKMVAP